jgi:glycosyltransferase involved in cell wall biosynthesis
MHQPASVSIVVPAHRSGPVLNACLDSLAALQPPPREIIIAIDGPDPSVHAAAAARGFQSIQLAHAPGVSATRNAGAAATTGQLILFIDSDIRVPADLVLSACRTLNSHPDATAAFGSYDATPAHQSLVSRYRNLLHHFTHQHANRNARTFWAGCGIIHRNTFLNSGGFDPRYRLPSIEDIDLGYRLTSAGHHIALNPSWQVCHLKPWRFASMIKTDTLDRAYPWSLLILNTRRTADNDLNTDVRSRFSAIAAAIAALSFLIAPWHPASLTIAIPSLIILWFLNRRFYALLFHCGRLPLAAAGLLLHPLYFLCALTGYSLAHLAAIRPQPLTQPASLPPPP